MLNIYFFFQAEDGIRDLYVTGVQTCALPILCVAGAGATWACARGAMLPRGATRRGASGLPQRARSRGRQCRCAARPQIGRASCRERVLISVDGVSVNKEI